MTKKKDGGPAFPIESWPTKFDKKGYVEAVKSFAGMSLRDYFAGEMLSGILANSEDWDEQVVAHNCYKMADAMLDEREKNQ